jgi:hypothetical protein
MTLLRKRMLLAAEIETTPGTAETLAAADATFNCYNVTFQQNVAFEERQAPAAFGRNQSVPGARSGTISFSVDASWDGTATEPTWADTFLPACGWVKSSQVFTPRTESPGTNVKTLTMAVYNDGIRWLMTGAAGTFTLVCPTGRSAVFNFTFNGIWSATADVAMLSPTYATALPLRFANSVTQWNSVDLCLENITLDSGNVVTGIECADNDSGFEYFMVTDRRVSVTANPLTKLVAGQDRYNKLLDMSEHALTWDLDGPTTSKMTFAAPKAQIVSINPGDRNGTTIDEIEWQCNRNGSTIDQEASITFTAAS